jgi:hypothetical protein
VTRALIDVAVRFDRTTVAETAFPPTSGAPRTTGGLVAALTVWIAGVAVMMARQGGAGALDTMYAEDGNVFLARAVEASPWASVTTTYAGYGHVVPRLAAEAVASVPPRLASVAATSAASLVAVGLGLLSARALRCHLSAPSLRWVVVAAFVALPVGREEVFNSIANLHWFLLPTAAVLLLWNPVESRFVVLGSAVVLLTALSDPLALALVPLALLRLAVSRARRAQVVPLALLAGVAVQLAVVALASTGRPHNASASLPRVVAWFGVDVVAATVLGDRFSRSASTGLGLTVAGLVGAAVVALGVFIGRRYGTRCLFRPALLALTALLLFGLAVSASGTHPPRYAVPPVLLLVMALLLTVDTWHPWTAPARTRTLALAGLVVIGIAWTANLPLRNERSNGPRWSAAVSESQASCRLEPAGTRQVPITPPGWSAVLPCSYLVP